MFCEKCGKPVDMDKNICEECAAKEQAENTVTTAEQTIVLDQVAEAPKKKKGGLLIGIVAAVAALAVLVAVLCMGPLKGLWLKTFGSPEEYMLYVEEKAAASAVQSFVENYAKLLKQTDGLEECTVDSTAHVLIGDKLITLLEQSLASNGMEADLGFLSDIAIGIDAGWNKDLFAIKMDLGLGEKQVVDLALFADPKAETALMGFPTLSEQYAQLPMTGMTNPSDTYALYQLLPAADNVGAVLETYTGIMLKYMDKVEKTTETVTVEGIEQQMTVLTLTVTAKDLSDMVIEILETAQTDKDLEAVLDAMSAYVNAINEQQYANYEEYAPEKVDIHAEMIEGIPDAIEQIRVDESTMEEGNYLQFTDYVDDDHNICGRAVEMFTENVSDGTIRYLTVTDGKKCALELDIDQQLHVAGEYTNNDGAVSGSFDITMENVNYMTVELTNCTEEKLQMKLIPTDAFLNDVLELEENVSSVLGLASPSLEIIYGDSETSATMELYLKAGDAILAGITMDSTMSKEASIQLPQGPYVDGEDTTAVTNWGASLDVEKLMDNLIAAGVSEDLIQALIMSLMYA